MKLSELLLANSILGEMQQYNRLAALEAGMDDSHLVAAEAALRRLVRAQGAQIESLSGAVAVLSATMDLLGELVVEKGLVDEAEFYDRLIDVVTSAQAPRAEQATAAKPLDLTPVVCVWCGGTFPRSEMTPAPTGAMCANCARAHST